ncbi:ring-cleaving dioxygenase [Rubrivirga sp. S365]|uniref:Ring-cleaving dioxygenase n=1 Tax=Rubrivirga litoralis TaxID=3075598 RepID=A0ABU3BTN3_9BACT|nr:MULTISPECIES: ring-cleaving dioxygenase [unclassified Rubrivirga]MDT0632656.1 ring-cleaving dioxygenase [Rubrivirga sp. F394]MDT7857167.1 ring-cleaving dioxygenase [Rubrivirga sp. S365]
MEPHAHKPATHGLHHVTVIAGDAQENVDFYTGTMGMRLVKKSINQDAPDVYHLFYADAVGTPGTDLTFFPIPTASRASAGPGQVVEVPLAVPTGSLDFWQERLGEHGVTTGEVETRFGERALPFEDPHGLRLALVETDDERPFVPWGQSPVPAEHQVRGLHAVRIWERGTEPTETLLTAVMGMEKVGEDGDWHRYAAPGGGSGTYADVKVVADAAPGRGGAGGVHHVAWRMHDDDQEDVLRSYIERVGLRPSPPINRFWFRSVYFHEPGGVLFELATDGPGFARDEDPEHLGETLVLPPWLEAQREQIEAGLPVLDTPHVGT